MHPILFHIPVIDLPVYSYGVMLGLAFISGWYLGMHFANREGIPYRVTMTTLVLVVIFALVGARLAHVITNPATMRMYGLFHALFASKCEGLVAYGGYILGTLAAYTYSRLRHFDFWSMADATTPSMVLGLGLTRIGCFLAGCCHGRVTDLPWGVSFPAGAQASRNIDCIPPGAVPGTVASLPVHPTQIYESMLGFALFPLALYLVKKRKVTGQAFLILVCCYAVGRFLLEFIRADNDRGTVFGVLSTSQFIGLVLFPLAIGMLIWRLKKGDPPPPPLSKEEIHQSLIEQGVIKPDGKTKKKAEPKSAAGAAKDKAAASGQGKKKKKKGKKRKR